MSFCHTDCFIFIICNYRDSCVLSMEDTRMPTLSGFFRRFENHCGNLYKKVYIPVGSEKGDCPYCKDGVLFRDREAETDLNLYEVYRCDICGRLYIEGININGWREFHKKVSPRRYFIETCSD
jgi:hypothetical protein